MGKKVKVNKKKFMSRLSVLIIILILIVFIFNLIFGKSDVSFDGIKLIVDKEDVTDSLQTGVYIDKNGNLYMTVEDIKEIFDPNIYYEESTNKLISTYGTKVAAIDLTNNTVQINYATIVLSTGVIKLDSDYYIPLSEITSLYNIEITTNEDSAIVLSLYKELITAQTTKKVSLKESASSFSSTLQKIEEGTEIVYIEDADKSGWIKVLTYDGNIGYIKEKYISEKNHVRTNMNDEDFSSNTADLSSSIEVTKKTLTSESLEDFDTRKTVVEKIISDMISAEKYTVNINLQDVDVETEKLERFIIELVPRLKEIGGSVVVSNNSILTDEFLTSYNI